VKRISFKEGFKIDQFLGAESEAVAMEAKAGRTDQTFGYDYVMASQYSQHPQAKEQLPAVIIVFNSITARDYWMDKNAPKAVEKKECPTCGLTAT